MGNLYKVFPLTLHQCVFIYLCFSHGFSCWMWSKFLLSWLAVLEPVIPSPNHITKLAQMKNLMPAFGWESWDEDKALPGFLRILFLFKGKKICFYQLWRSDSKAEVNQFYFNFGSSTRNSPLKGWRMQYKHTVCLWFLALERKSRNSFYLALFIFMQTGSFFSPLFPYTLLSIFFWLTFCPISTYLKNSANLR